MTEFKMGDLVRLTEAGKQHIQSGILCGIGCRSRHDKIGRVVFVDEIDGTPAIACLCKDNAPYWWFVWADDDWLEPATVSASKSETKRRPARNRTDDNLRRVFE